jgi:aryl-alcohol dehydrogenase-like predicted oxidoreductase
VTPTCGAGFPETPACQDAFVLATKGHFPFGWDDPYRRANSRPYLTEALDVGLRRLGTDWIDLYQVHRPDPHMAIEETLSALDDFVRAGKIRAYGCSTFPGELLVEARVAADRLRVMGFRTEQPAYRLGPWPVTPTGADGQTAPRNPRLTDRA